MLYELLHKPDTFPVLEHFNRDAPGAEELLLPHEGPVLADDYAGNSVQENGPRAHGAGSERGHESAHAVDRSRLTTGVLEGIHFTVQDGAKLLNAPIVAPADNRIAVYNYRADRNASFQEALLRFLDRDFEKLVGGIHLCLLLK